MTRTLLLADDSTTIQRVIELTFADEDISVVACSNGDHAIASLDRSAPDIVLADIGMPGKSGYDVARHIKETPSLSHIPVLLLTGAFEPVDQARADEVGCDGVLTKPFEPQLVISRVKELLAKPKAGTKEAEVEDYFEQLDQAFASLAATTPVAPVHDNPAGESTPDTTVEKEETAPSAVPKLTDAFSALLAVERSGSSPLAAFPAERPASAAASPLPIDDLVERVVRRVLERMSDNVVRETVAGIVSATAERVVREEIERIKSNIK